MKTCQRLHGAGMCGQTAVAIVKRGRGYRTAHVCELHLEKIRAECARTGEKLWIKKLPSEEPHAALHPDPLLR